MTRKLKEMKIRHTRSVEMMNVLLYHTSGRSFSEGKSLFLADYPVIPVHAKSIFVYSPLIFFKELE
jgi:hypothetical protein